jgi:hypothetical protein
VPSRPIHVAPNDPIRSAPARPIHSAPGPSGLAQNGGHGSHLLSRRPFLMASSPQGSSFRATALVVLAYGVAMGFLEAAVVVYLRAALGLTEAVGPAAHVAAGLGDFAEVEGAREFATLVMIAAVGWLAGRRGLERLAWAAVIFGAWDIVYYVGLNATSGWPPDLTTWDVLFLLPSPWVGPVWAPIVVSGALVIFGLVFAARLRSNRTVTLRRPAGLLAGLGGCLVVLSFLLDARRVLDGDLAPWSGWPVFLAGMALGLAAAGLTLRGGQAGTSARPVSRQ